MSREMFRSVERLCAKRADSLFLGRAGSSGRTHNSRAHGRAELLDYAESGAMVQNWMEISSKILYKQTRLDLQKPDWQQWKECKMSLRYH